MQKLHRTMVASARHRNGSHRGSGGNGARGRAGPGGGTGSETIPGASRQAAGQSRPEEKDELAKAGTRFFKSFGRFNRFKLNGELRRAMRQETEKSFEYVVREDRNLLELLDSDYAFLNKRLADHYGLPDVAEMKCAW